MADDDERRQSYREIHEALVEIGLAISFEAMWDGEHLLGSSEDPVAWGRRTAEALIPKAIQEANELYRRAGLPGIKSVVVFFED